MLTMPERLLLISIDHRGRPRDPRSTLGHALAGAALTELLLAGRLRYDDGRVVAATAGPTGEPLLDEVVTEIRGEERPRTLKWWVQRLASRHHGRNLLAQASRHLPAVGIALATSACARGYVQDFRQAS